MNEIFIPIIAGIIGLCAGSFISVLVVRLRKKEKGILTGRSKCPNCHKKLSAKELIPLLSFLFQKGLCTKCKKAISWSYPCIELSTGIIFFLIALKLQTSPLYILDWSWKFWVLIFIFFYDLFYKEIHYKIMLPAMLLAIISALTLGGTMGVPQITAALYGAGFGAMFFILQWLFSRGTWVGIGDFSIGAFMGLIFGFKACFLAILSGYIIGSVICLSLLAAGKLQRNSQVPLGPFLVAGCLLTFFFENTLIKLFL